MNSKLLSLVLCLSLLFSVRADDNEIPANERDLKILSWNIYMLPGIVPVANRTARAEVIADTLAKMDYDIIIFQEAFHKKAVKVLRKGLKDLYPYMYGPFNQTKNPFRVNSGVWILSKIPLKDLGVIQYKNGKVADKLALKGAALLEGTTARGQVFQLLGTHMQAEDEFPQIRRDQFDQIYNELLSVHKKEGVPQIVCGDLNTRSDELEEYNYMLTKLNVENGAISGAQKTTYDGRTNELARKVWKDDSQIIDYVLIRKNGATIRSAYRAVSVLRKEWKKGKTDLSDHYGMIFELKF